MPIACCSCFSRSGDDYSEFDHDKAASKKVDADLAVSRLTNDLHWKVLLLGAGESGKSTVIKQLQFIHQPKIPEKDLRACAQILQGNAIESLQNLINNGRELGIEFSEDETEMAANFDDMESGDALTPDLALMGFKLWNGKAIQSTYAQREKFWLYDTTAYYLNNITRFAEEDYLPNEEDYVMARTRTTGIITTDFYEEPISFSIVDVGGQRSERKKWLQCFDDVKAVLFVVNLAGYDRIMFEADKNRMVEAMELLQNTVSNKVFNHVPIFLFLNKKDLFEEMIRKTPITKLFPDYAGKPDDVHASMEFIANKFKERLPQGKEFAGVATIAARFKKDVKYAFEDMKKVMLKKNESTVNNAVNKLKSMGMDPNGKRRN